MTKNYFFYLMINLFEREKISNAEVTKFEITAGNLMNAMEKVAKETTEAEIKNLKGKESPGKRQRGFSRKDEVIEAAESFERVEED